MIIVTSMGFGNTLFSIDCEVYNDPQAIIDSGTSNIVLNSVVYTQVIARIRKEVFLLIPNFNPRYLNDGVPCCETYCTTDDINAPLLQLSSITVSFAYEDDTSRSQFTVSIPPQYYWRPIVFKGTKGSLTSCRLFGISEGTGTIFGNAFMVRYYTLYPVHNTRYYHRMDCISFMILKIKIWELESQRIVQVESSPKKPFLKLNLFQYQTKHGVRVYQDPYVHLLYYDRIGLEKLVVSFGFGGCMLS